MAVHNPRKVSSGVLLIFKMFIVFMLIFAEWVVPLDKLRLPVSAPLLLIRAVGLLFIPLIFEMTGAESLLDDSGN